ncbi:MAG: aspartate/glutamate racemase family protein [Minwuia sp.]|uniref:maleate cis-trans isomerase family protein n=1 Tax=Minwuia sp. TaxID=2493630 RepID=UPI003A873DD9
MNAPLTFEIDGGAGGRAAVGLIVLQVDETMEIEFRSIFERAGVALYHSRIPSSPELTAATIAEMKAELPRAASLLPVARPLDAVAYGCTSGATVIGQAEVAKAVRQHHPNSPVTDPITAVTAALRKLGCRRIGFLTPYVAHVSTAMRELLEGEGFEIASYASFEQSTEATVARITEASVLDAMTGVGSTAEADCVFASCTNLRTFGVIEEAEARLGKPVITSNQALAWHLLELAGLDATGAGPGRLFA